MVLYHCCTSLAEAQAIERNGFGDQEVVRVTDRPPDVDGRDVDVLHEIVMLGVPFDFRLEEFPVADDATGERLVPALVLNQFPRAIWPE